MKKEHTSFTFSFLLLQMDPGALNFTDAFGNTPLMVAAIKAAGSRSRDGIQDTKVIDLLLQKRANRDLIDEDGMSAYGLLTEKLNEYSLMMSTMLGKPPSSEPDHPSVTSLKRKLMPSTGPTDADAKGGKEQPGFIDYSDGELESDDESFDF